MDILNRIVEAVAQKLIFIRLTEETVDPMDNAKGDLIRRIHAKRKFKKAIGSNNRRDTLGGSVEGQEDYKDMMSDKKKKTKPMPLNIPTKSKRGAKVNPKKVKGKSINTSRGNAKVIAAKATANEVGFNKLMQSLAKKKEKKKKDD
jgi:hypothetical protein